MRPEYTELARKHFGIEAVKPEQQEVWTVIDKYQCDMLVVMPTGFGKSLTFQIPALEFWQRERRGALVICEVLS